MIKINMGCGIRNFGEDWIHIDGGDYEHLDYKSITDLRQFEDNSVDLIYASHVIQYFDRVSVIDLLSEWRRVMKSDATLRLAVPDFNSIAQLYIDNKFNLNNFTGPLYGKMIMSEATIYHKTVYDLSSLKNLLENCGFSSIEVYDWKLKEHGCFDDHSQSYLPHMDKIEGTLISLNVECKK